MRIDELTTALAPYFADISARLDQLEKQLSGPEPKELRAAVDALTIARQPDGEEALKALSRMQMKGGRKRGH